MDTRDVALTVLLDIETNQTFSNIALGNALRKKPVYGQGRTRFFYPDWWRVSQRQSCGWTM